jgi:hypothetical protein
LCQVAKKKGMTLGKMRGLWCVLKWWPSQPVALSLLPFPFNFFFLTKLHQCIIPFHQMMIQKLLLLLVAVLVLTASSVSAFTPENAAFKLSQIQAASLMDNTKSNVITYSRSYSNEERRGRRREIVLENLRKSVPVPPSFEDYMRIRARAAQQKKKD